jgi:hypothetical protein
MAASPKTGQGPMSRKIHRRVIVLNLDLNLLPDEHFRHTPERCFTPNLASPSPFRDPMTYDYVVSILSFFFWLSDPCSLVAE